MEIKKMNIIFGVIALIITMSYCFYFGIVQKNEKRHTFVCLLLKCFPNP